MKKVLLIVFICWGAVSAAFYVSDPEVFTYNNVEIKASYYPDKSVSENLNAFFLEVKNNSAYDLRLEPNFNSVLYDNNNRRYYRQKVNSPAEFLPGTIGPKSERKGFIYFKNFQQKNNNKFKLIIKNIKLYDGSSAQEAQWKFVAVSGNSDMKLRAIELSESIADNPDITAISVKNLENLEYDKQLMLAKAERENYDRLKFKIEMPSNANRGDTLQLKIFAPTIVEVESVTALIGISQYVDLHKEPGGVFSGFFRVPELLDYGKYVVSFYIRFPDGNKTIRQKTLEVKSY